ncbi:MAG: hypothetical protein F6K40_04180 [Okeania sp. SIO3I5]|uniref:hypothetical protein n=1 Tax=Okeania sp. SIO3I5 TaxID=2607805 RepID=UPI0013B95EC0|nr:hypothetical protein [Okeania sp. SIO3I5]NEQ35539.1 hypothetical protein [Okeania sp. SIO3I5]
MVLILKQSYPSWATAGNTNERSLFQNQPGLRSDRSFFNQWLTKTFCLCYPDDINQHNYQLSIIN